MTKLSRRNLNKDQMGLLIDQLWRSFASLKNKDEVHTFLHDILTHTEIRMLSKRLQVVIMLEEGYTYKEISNTLNISQSTITKIQNWKQQFGQGYKLVIDRLSSKKKKPGYKRIISSRSAAVNIWR